MKITVKPINAENYADALALKLLPEQENYVTPPTESLAMAYVYYAQSLPVGLYADEKMVGYALLLYDRDAAAYSICHFSIDAAEQGKGYGKEALGQLLLLAAAKPLGEADQVLISCAGENAAMKKLCKGFGFTETGKQDGDFIEMSLPIAAIEMPDGKSLPDELLRTVTGGVTMGETDSHSETSISETRTSRDSAKIKTGDSRRQLSAEERTPAYIHRQIFGKKFEEVYGA